MKIFDRIDFDIYNLNFAQKIAIINVLVFLVFRLSFLFKLESDFLNLFSLSSNFFYNPWSIITHAFIHQGIFDLVFMLILLFFSCNSISNLLGEKITIYLFFVGIILGSIFFLLFSNSQNILIGASAGISSLLIFLLFLSPNLELRFFRFNIKFKYLMALILFTDFLRFLSPGEFGIYSHIGGYLAGTFYYFSIYGLPKKYKKPRTIKPTNKQKETDYILDKISRSGYDSLTSKEKDFLFRQKDKK
ncbi:MAG: hypothetical protein CMC90_03505 [Flavobacteriaceae bacterium]|nr:hypothetical protein [Flavobacteriaceae bacterium]